MPHTFQLLHPFLGRQFALKMKYHHKEIREDSVNSRVYHLLPLTTRYKDHSKGFLGPPSRALRHFSPIWALYPLPFFF